MKTKIENKKYVDLKKEIMGAVTSIIPFPQRANELTNKIEDLKLNDEISYACSDCIREGFEVGFQTALNILKGTFDILL